MSDIGLVVFKLTERYGVEVVNRHLDQVRGHDNPCPTDCDLCRDLGWQRINRKNGDG